MARFLKISACLCVFILTACNPQDGDKNLTHNSQNTSNQTDEADQLIGCYTVNKNTPAQIKISKQKNDYVMQMKEPKGAKTAWDKPEPLLKAASLEQGWEFFRVNSLDFTKDDTEAIIVRPDKRMALAKVKDASQNINPKLDSNFVIHIFGAVNTIYSVACDDTRMDIVKTN